MPRGRHCADHRQWRSHHRKGIRHPPLRFSGNAETESPAAVPDLSGPCVAAVQSAYRLDCWGLVSTSPQTSGQSWFPAGTQYVSRHRCPHQSYRPNLRRWNTHSGGSERANRAAPYRRSKPHRHWRAEYCPRPNRCAIYGNLCSLGRGVVGRVDAPAASQPRTRSPCYRVPM